MTNKTTVQIYGPSFSNFVRSAMLICEENGVSYNVGFEIDGRPVEFKSEAHLALHPYGKLPVLIHDDFILPETAAICRYIQTNLSSKETSELSAKQLARLDAFSALASIYLDKAIIRDYIIEFAFPKGENGDVRLDVVKQAQSGVRAALSVIEQELAKNELLNTQNFTLADALVAPMIHYISTLPSPFNLLEEFPVVNNYLTQLMTRASCKKVLIAK